MDAKAFTQVIKAFNKVLLIQNDLFARHYMPEKEVEERYRRISSRLNEVVPGPGNLFQRLDPPEITVVLL